MPPKHVHATQTLLVFGRTWFDLHHQKDSPWRDLGSRHRSLHHDWYQDGRAGAWTLDDPFPDWVRNVAAQIAVERGGMEAEEYEVSMFHDVADRLWDELDRESRLQQEAFWCWLALNPAYMLDIGQVDVVNGRIHRILDNGEEVWEHEPELVVEYRRLRRYVEAVLERSPTLCAEVQQISQTMI